MQTFLAYPEYEDSLVCLDKRRLLKQTVEASQLIDGLLGIGSLTWRKHPASKMFSKNINSLIRYYNLSLRIGKIRDGTKWSKLVERPYVPEFTMDDPIWLGSEAFHSRMRAKLLGKQPDWYYKFGWTEEPVGKNTPYIWPGA